MKPGHHRTLGHAEHVRDLSVAEVLVVPKHQNLAMILAQPLHRAEERPLALPKLGVELLPGPFLDFLDPWGNRVELTTYTNIQFTKADHVLQGMGLGHLRKTDTALAELRDKGMAPA